MSSVDAGEEATHQWKLQGKTSPRKSKSSPSFSASAVAHTPPSSLGSGSKRIKRAKAMSESELSPLVTGKLSPGTPSEFGQPHLAAVESDDELLPKSAPQIGQLAKTTQV